MGTKLFSAAYSSAPSTPSLAIFTGSGNGTLVDCGTMASSSSIAFYRFFTVPNTPNTIYGWEIVGSFTNGPVVQRGTFVGVKTTA